MPNKTDRKKIRRSKNESAYLEIGFLHGNNKDLGINVIKNPRFINPIP